MKKLILLFFVSLAMMANAQVVRSVCGVNFGDSYSKVKNSLENKFGEPLHASEKMIAFLSVDYGGLHFDMATFEFVNGQLNAATFLNLFKTEKKAKDFVKEIAGVLRGSYTLTQDGDDYYGGTSPKNSNKYGLMVNHWKNSSKMADYPYCAGISYGPYGYGESF